MTAAAAGAALVRRLVLRRGMAALAGIVVTRPRTPPVPDLNIDRGWGGAAPIAVPSQGPENDPTRNALADFLRKDQDRLWAQHERRYEVFYVQDPDLVVLQSTSQSWRATVMRDRLRARQSAMDVLNKRLESVWKDPLDKVRELLATWTRKI